MAGESYQIPQAPRMIGQFGVRTAYGHILPPAGRVAAYVCNGTCQDAGDKQFSDNLVTTLSDGLKRCRSGYRDTVYVLPGHSESVVDATMLDNLVPGTQIIGIGDGSSMPVFRWTTSTSAQWKLDDANVRVEGLRLRLEGVNAVTKAINITAADCVLANNDIEVASGASNICAIAIECGAGSTRTPISQNRIRGSVGNAVTDGIKIVSAVEGIEILGNRMQFAATSANGQIHITAAATGLFIAGNIMYNTVAGGQFNIVTAAVAADGVACDNYLGCLKGGGTAPASDGFSVGVGTLIVGFQNFAVGVAIDTGSAALAPAVDT